jgi:hypothetical protein
MAETPLHAAPLVSVLHGALFTRRRQPHVQDRRAFGAEARSRLGRVAPPRASCPCCCCSRTQHSRPVQRAPGFLEPSLPEHSQPRLRHRRPAQPCGAIPAHNPHVTGAVLASLLKSRTAKVSLRDRSRMRTENRQRGQTRVRLPKTNFPNSSPSSVRAVLKP